ncbi:hypothetical protein HYD58_02510 [Mycoplasmopsis bovis]|nr:hypothetical protein [Mycoplasmopsis bovis]QQH66119.1 hypothetical protein HYD58_02510 [Mycoplasmopsis bovis]
MEKTTKKKTKKKKKKPQKKKTHTQTAPSQTAKFSYHQSPNKLSLFLQITPTSQNQFLKSEHRSNKTFNIFNLAFIEDFNLSKTKTSTKKNIWTAKATNDEKYFYIFTNQTLKTQYTMPPEPPGDTNKPKTTHKTKTTKKTKKKKKKTKKTKKNNTTQQLTNKKQKPNQPKIQITKKSKKSKIKKKNQIE